MIEKKTTKKEKVEEKKVEAGLIISPRVTEKASKESVKNVYTFLVSKNANKTNLKKEVIAKYKVTPKFINITNVPKRKVFVRGKIGMMSGYKKAVISLKKGDSIKLS